jgi:hypothetical protein
VGSLISGVGLGYLALKNKGNLEQVLKNPLDYYTKPAGKNKQRLEWLDEDGQLKSAREFNPGKPNPSFLSSGRKLNWDKVGQTAGVVGGAVTVPISLAYLAGSKKDKEDIQNRIDKTWGKGNKTLNDVRTWINTLHRVSR